MDFNFCKILRVVSIFPLILHLYFTGSLPVRYRLLVFTFKGKLCIDNNIRYIMPVVIKDDKT